MKKILCLLCLVCLLPVSSAAEGESVSIFGRSIPKNARVLDLSGVTDVSAQQVSELLSRLPDVKEALLYDASFTSAQAGELRGRYPDVFFGLTFRLEDHVVRTDQTAFSTLHNNRSPVHTAQDFDFLRHCVRLEALDLGHNAISDIGFLENLTELKVLIIALNDIRDISPLKNLKKLEYLEMFRNKVKDISPLAELRNLLDLNMGYNYVKDYTPLFALSKLERLWLYQSNGYSAGPMPKQTLREIRQALPGCYVDGVWGGTGGEWRKHPRYNVIFDIFKTSVYRPFE